MAAAWLAIAGTGVPVDAHVADVILLTAPAAALAAVLGVGLGAIVAKQVTAVLIVVGWVMAIEQAISGAISTLDRQERTT